MVAYDLRSKLSVEVGLGPQSVASTSSTAARTSAVDTALYESVTFVTSLGSIGSTAGTITGSLEDSTGSTAGTSTGTYAAVSTDFIIGGNVSVTASTTNNNTAATAGYVGHKRYVRQSLTFPTTDANLVGVDVIKENARHNPATT